MLQVKKQSFSLIEVVVSVGIFLLVIGSLIALGLVNSRNLVISKHRLQAVNLAREGVEKVIEVRDTAWLNIGNAQPMTYWADNMTGTTPPINPCWGLSSGGGDKVVELYTGAAGSGCTTSHPRLVTGPESPITPPNNDGVSYTRHLTIEAKMPDGNGNTDFLKVTAKVTWDDFGTQKNATVVTYLSNWIQK